MSEQWKPVPGFEGIYEVSDRGGVRSLPRVVERRDGVHLRLPGHELKPHINDKGRPAVTLHRDGRGRPALVHRLVLEAFVGPNPPGMECCHNNGISTDNHLSNLRWDTRTENMLDIVRHGYHHNASRTHCTAGHPLDGDNLRVSYRNGRPRRNCQTCRADNARRSYATGRAAVAVTCPLCGETRRKDTLPRHLRTMHAEERVA